MFRKNKRVLSFLTCVAMLFAFSAQAVAAGAGPDGIFAAEETQSEEMLPTTGTGEGTDTPEMPGEVVDEASIAQTDALLGEEEKIDISPGKAWVGVPGEFTYTGQPIEPEVVVTLDGGITLTRDIDYTVTYENNINATPYSTNAYAIVTGIGAYTGENVGLFNIKMAYRDAPPPAPAAYVVNGVSLTLLVQPDQEYLLSFDAPYWQTFHYVEPGEEIIYPLENLPDGMYQIETRYAETQNYYTSNASVPFVFEWRQQPVLNEGQIPQPDDVRFDGTVLWWRMVAPEGAPEDWDCQYEVEILHNNTGGWRFSRDVRGEHKYDIVEQYFEEEGLYEIRLTAYDLYDEYEPSEPLVLYYQYTKSGNQLEVATELEWLIEDGVVYTTFFQTNDEEDLNWHWSHLIEVCKEDGGYFWSIYSNRISDGFGKTDVWKNLAADETYKFRVRMLSSNINRISHSEWSEWSGPLRIGDALVDIDQALRDIAQKLQDGDISAGEALGLLKELDQGELRLAMQTDTALRELIAALEKAYMEELGISSNVEVSDFIADKLEGEISVVGAGFSSAGGDVTLNFENKKENVPIESRYVNYVQFSIELDGATDDSQLEVPIRITMPIPKPLSVNRLVIMHYTKAGTYEPVEFILNGNGTISFTVTHLSEFVFAEEPDGSDPIIFADENFKQALIWEGFDTDGDGEISYDEAAAVTDLWMEGRGIYDLSGIEHFTNLESLGVGYNNLTSLDVTMLPKLEYLYCSENFDLVSLNVTGMTTLKDLVASECSLGSLDLRTCTALESVGLNNCGLTQLQVSGLQFLQSLDCSGNPFVDFELQDLPALEHLWVDECGLTALDVSGLPALKGLGCSFNNLTSLDVSGLQALTDLYVSNNMLSTLTLGSLPLLSTLYCYDNQLAALDISGLPQLYELYCNNNRLAALDISGQLELRRLNCASNLLTGLDVTGLSNLQRLDCRFNLMPDMTALTGYSNPPTNILFFYSQNSGQPSMPLALRAVRAGSTIELTWQAPATDGGSPITHYEIVAYGSDIDDWLDIGLVTTYTITGANNADDYIVNLRAVNENGEGFDTSVYLDRIQQPISGATITLSGTYVYTGEEVYPEDTLAVVLDGVTLVYEEDYYIYTVGDVINAGTAIVEVSGAGGYKGSVMVRYTIEKAPQAAPAALAIESLAPNSVTFAAIPGAEYRMGTGGAWQDSPVFTGLIPGQSYSFYARLKEQDNYHASPVSPAREIDTEAVQLSGTVLVTGTAKFGETLTADTGGLSTIPASQLGTLYYQWKRDGGEIAGATAAAYQLAAADIGKTITVTVSAEGCNGDVTGTLAAMVEKADGPAAPAAPTMAGRTGESITLDVIAGARYREGVGGTWQDSPTFTGLAPSTSYTFYAQIGETATHKESAVSAGGTFTTLKAPQTAPAAPLLESKTADSVTLVSIAGAQYRAGTAGVWQDSPAFTGLSPNTTYAFYARLKETDTHEASPASVSLPVTTDKAVLGGSVSISGTAKFDEVLTAETGTLTATPSTTLGTLSYQWKRDGAAITGATASTYTLVEADIGKTLTLTVSAANCTGEVESTATVAVARADGPAVPAVTGRYTGDSHTFTYTVDAIPGAEYSQDNITWQDSNSFSGFAVGNSVTFYARMKETTTHEAGAAGDTGAVLFARLDDRAAPALTYTICEDRTAITITAVAGAEYKFDGGAWSTVNTKTGYTGNETVTLQIRYALTDTHNPSAANSTMVDLNKLDKAAPEAFAMAYAYNKVAGTFTVTIPAVENGEYSFDGVLFTGANTTTAAPGTFVTGYVRYKATATHNTSPAAVAALTLPTPAASVSITGAGGATGITTKNGTLQLTAAVLPAAATQSVTWSVMGGTGSATVTGAGLVTAKTDGSVTVRATATDGTGEYGEITLQISGQSTLSMGGLPESNQFRVGESITLVPQGVSDTHTGSNGWNYDGEFFSATFNSPATFTALKAGTSTITYTAPDGQSWSVTFTILEREAGGTVDGTVQTGDTMAWLWWAALAMLASGTGVLLLQARRKQKAKNSK